MKISGFTFIKNASIYDFQLEESLRSVLPLVDELIVVAGDSEDDTNARLEAMACDKIKVVHTVWDFDKYPHGGQQYAYQTDLALKGCSGDWCVYIQSDEVLHEQSIEPIRKACQYYLHDHEVEGFVLPFTHIYGDYRRYIDALHFAYPREVRVVRRREDIHSWGDAQTFRVMPDFDYKDYAQEEGTRRLRCVELPEARMFHYGWSRDPRRMAGKLNAAYRFYHPDAPQQALVEGVDFYDYGNLSRFPLYKGSQPAEMAERIERMDWAHLVRYKGPNAKMRKKFGFKYRIINFLEKAMGGGRRIGGFRTYKRAGRFVSTDSTK